MGLDARRNPHGFGHFVWFYEFPVWICGAFLVCANSYLLVNLANVEGCFVGALTWLHSSSAPIPNFIHPNFSFLLAW